MLFSHPGKPLIQHLQEVAGHCKEVVDARILFPDAPAAREALSGLAYLAGAFHDLGKGTRYFQAYLLSGGKVVPGQPKSHALISALFVKEIAAIYLERVDLPGFDRRLYTHFAFTAVKRHHGSLLDFGDEMDIEKKSKELQEQVAAFEEADAQALIEHFSQPLELTYSFADFKRYILSKKYLDDMPAFFDDNIHIGGDYDYEHIPLQVKIRYFYFHQLLFGALLLSDKRDVILDDERYAAAPTIPDDVVDAFKRNKIFQNAQPRLDAYKNQAYQGALDRLEAIFDPGRHIYSITLPTGLGKTITSFAVACKMKALLGTPRRRLVVAIPFTSIIDQNFQVFEEILGDCGSDVLLKHHHLAEPVYKQGDDELDADKSQFLIETWQSEVVVTTFVQLLNSVFSNNKSLLMKTPNLANAIIILDEIQTIPYEHWGLLKEVFEALGDIYHCYFILMTATQPMIFLPEREITEIIPDYESYFRIFNRTKLFNRTQARIALDDFIQVIEDYHVQYPQKDLLVILNTKKHSRECFEKLVKRLNLETVEAYYLSTLITPYERKKIIRRIKTPSGKPKIIVSTQLIEAGVDVSVDTVFRGMAPLDSIIQAAGRANRYDEKPQQGEVWLYDVEETARATAMIYGAALLAKTGHVLRNIAEIEERDYLALIHAYFKEVRKQSENTLSVYLAAIGKLEFEQVGAFSLIEESRCESVFLQLNEEARDVWNAFDRIYSDESAVSWKKKQAFSKIKARFYDYVINVPIPWSKQSIVFDDDLKPHGFYLSTLDRPTACYRYEAENYSFNTGYKELTHLQF